MAAKNFTSSELASVLSYDPGTGAFVRLRTGLQVGNKSGAGYITIWALGKAYYAHRLAWLLHTGNWPTGVIDHINGCRTDNRIGNLRDTTQSENIRAKRVGRGASGVVGVQYQKGAKRWIARISFEPLAKTTHLGSFKTMDEAIDARRRAERLRDAKHPSLNC